MPFYAIKGNFVPSAGVPDGDSVRFRAKNLALWKKLEGRPPQIGTGVETKGTVQLRFEGIDAIEKAAQKPLADDAKHSMFALIGYDKEKRPTPDGYVLARMTDDKTGRPIAFVFAGKCPWADGAEVRLTAAQLRKSVNYKQILAGYAYPLYYNTLFAELRRTFDVALKAARAARRGYWPTDKTRKGVVFKGAASLATIDPVWPKLWRRLQEFARGGKPMSQFIAFLEQKNERLDVLDVMEERGLQDVVRVVGNKVSMTEPPENLRIRGKAGKRR
jgi:endonuclease YncB( thermonuclease family)